MNSILKANQLTKTFDAATIPVHAVKEVNIDIHEGEITVLTGRSGSGKSTYKDKSYDDLNSNELTKLRRSDMGFVYQFHYLLNELTAIENVSLPLLMNNLEKKEVLEKSKEILNILGLSHRFTHKPSEMSGGEKQRVAIARSMVHSPSLVILDEPTGELDSQTALEVIESLKNYVSDVKSSLIIATHDMNFKEISDQTLIMDSGII